MHTNMPIDCRIEKKQSVAEVKFYFSMDNVHCNKSVEKAEDIFLNNFNFTLVMGNVQQVLVTVHSGT